MVFFVSSPTFMFHVCFWCGMGESSVCVCRFFSAGLKPKASACDGRCEDPNKARK